MPRIATSFALATDDADGPDLKPAWSLAAMNTEHTEVPMTEDLLRRLREAGGL